ncbi:MAG: phosphatase PAP2 family protein [Bacteroidales bacterium]|nr:phosphatase PAP2 family protein [Bacteroidales bacterium]
MFWEEVHHIDQLVTLEINSWDSPITDPIWQFFSDKLVWAPMYVAIIALLIWKLGWKKGLLVLAGALLTFGFCDQFSNLIKHAVERIRPLHDEFMVSNGLNILEKGGGYSFFSAHSANSFGLAFSTFLGMKLCLRDSGSSITPKWLKSYGAWMFFWATMVAVSRIFVGKHYLGDVIVGIIVGSLAGIAFGWLANFIAHKMIH